MPSHSPISLPPPLISPLMRRLFTLFILLLVGSAFATPRIFLASRATDGLPLPHGSGWAGGHSFLRPLVSDQGAVAFIAPDPDPDFANGELSPYRASFHAWPKQAANVNNPTIIHAGHKIFFGTHAMPIWHLAAIHPDLLNQCFAVQEGQDGDTYTQLLGPQIFPRDITATVPAESLAAINLRLSANGNLLAIGTNDGARIWQVTATAFAEIDLTGTPLVASTGRVGLSADGQFVSFASRTLDSTGLLHVYRYNRSTDQLEVIAAAENMTGTLDAQVTITPDGKTIAFVSNNYRLWHMDTDDGRGTQILIAEREDDTTYRISLAATNASVLVQASEPAISDNGRFIVFKAGGTPQQIYRLDRLDQTIQLASTGHDDLDTNAAAQVPVISPNGRYAAFVRQATNGRHHTWLADFGPSLTGGTLHMAESTSAQLPLTLLNANPDDQLRWTAPSSLPGTITGNGANGESITIEANANYPLDSLPWNFTAATGAAENHFTVKLLNADGDKLTEAAIDLKVRLTNVAQQIPLSCNNDNQFITSGGLPPYASIALSLDELGHKIAFTTTAQLLPDFDLSGNDWDIYLRLTDNETAVLTMLTESVNISADCIIALSGDGRMLFHSTAAGGLRQITLSNNDATMLPNTADATAIVSSYDGATLAMVKNGQPGIYHNNNFNLLDEQVDNATKALISRDGQTAAFLTNAGKVLVWCAADQSWRQLAENISHFSMTLDGGTLICQDKDNGDLALLNTGTGELTSMTLPGLAPTVNLVDLTQPTISGNGQFLVYVRENQSISQLYRYDLHSHQENMMSTTADGLPGNANSGLPLAISTNGERIAYVTAATNVLPGKPQLNTRELTLAILPNQDGDAPNLSDTSVTALEAADIIIPLAITSAQGVALPVLTQSPQHGTATFIGPAAGRNGYALRLIPEDQYFCGYDDIKIKIFDGRQWSEELTLQLTIENVNNAPFWLNTIPAEAVAYEIFEGETTFASDTVSLTPWAEDYDLPYANFTNEKLTFSLQNAPEWLALDQENRLVCLQAPGYELAQRDVNDGKTDITCQVRVTDQEDEWADLTVTVTVVNVNRPPEVIAAPQRVLEGVALKWSDFQLNDPDLGDQDTLQIVFNGTSKGAFHSENNPGAGPQLQFAATDFPVIFEGTAGASNSDQVTIQAVDDSGATSEPLTVTILLRQFSLPLVELWPASDSLNAVLPAQYPGWAMLSTPVDLNEQQLLQILPDSAWIWNSDKQTYAPIADTIKAGTGFYVFFLEEPDFGNNNLTGERDLAKELPDSNGWHLLGVPYTYLLPEDTSVFSGLPASAYLRQTSKMIGVGQACWFFREREE